MKGAKLGAMCGEFERAGLDALHWVNRIDDFQDGLFCGQFGKGDASPEAALRYDKAMPV